MSHIITLLLISALHYKLASSLHQNLEADDASRNVEDFISAVSRFEQMKYLGGDGRGENGNKNGAAENIYKNKRKIKKRRRRKKINSILNERNKNVVRVEENDTVNLNRQKDIFVTNNEKRNISNFISKVCSTSNKSKHVARFCYQRRNQSVKRPQSILSAIFSIFSW